MYLFSPEPMVFHWFLEDIGGLKRGIDALSHVLMLLRVGIGLVIVIVSYVLSYVINLCWIFHWT